MRYNGYKLNKSDFPDDPSNNNPGFGISSRYDLDKEYNLSGAIDCKNKPIFLDVFQNEIY